MKISDLITKLQTLQSEWGDLPVRIMDTELGGTDDVIDALIYDDLLNEASEPAFTGVPEEVFLEGGLDLSHKIGTV